MIERAQASQPDLIILDTDLPDRDGFEVCRELRAMPELSPATPILITSPGHPSRQKRLEALRGLEIEGVDELQLREAPSYQPPGVIRFHVVAAQADWPPHLPQAVLPSASI